MGFGTGFDMGVKQLIVAIVALKSYPSCKLSWDNSFWLGKKRWIRPATKYSQTQTSSRNEKDAQRHLEPGTPSILPRSFFWSLLVKTRSCYKPSLSPNKSVRPN